MQVFAVFGLGDFDWIQSAVQMHYESQDYRDVGHAFLVADKGITSQQVGEKLGLNSNAASRSIIVPVTSYWGLHAPDTWEWIRVKLAHNGSN